MLGVYLFNINPSTLPQVRDYNQLKIFFLFITDLPNLLITDNIIFGIGSIAVVNQLLVVRHSVFKFLFTLKEWLFEIVEQKFLKFWVFFNIDFKVLDYIMLIDLTILDDLMEEISLC